MSNNELFKDKYRIPSARLLDWDYGCDAIYFITICTYSRRIFFGEVIDSEIILNSLGKIVEQFWLQIPEHFPGVYLDRYIVMPNHLHGILDIQINYEEYKKKGKVNVEKSILDYRCRDEAMPRLYKTDKNFYKIISPKPKSLPVIIGSFKSICTRTINQKFPKVNFAWQSRFYEHIIKNNKSLENIRDYILNNSSNWEKDRNNPINL